MMKETKHNSSWDLDVPSWGEEGVVLALESVPGCVIFFRVFREGVCVAGVGFLSGTCIQGFLVYECSSRYSPC